MEATGKFDYTATADDELSFKKGEIIKILGTKDDWYRAEKCGKQGFVPKNYIVLHIPSWYQEDISRQKAESILKTQPIGGFIIRDSQSSPGDLSISVRHEFDVQHFKVLLDKKGQYFLWNVKFSSLNKLVDYYAQNSISKQSCVRLLTEQRGTLDVAPEPRPSPRSQIDVHDRTVPHPQERREKIESTKRLAGFHSPPSRPVESFSPPQSSSTQVKALFDFTAEEKDELNFKAGDIIEVVGQSNSFWMMGRLHGRTGLFPSNYTTPL